jgi:hypothetical protein
MTHLVHALAVLFAGFLAAALFDASSHAQGREPPIVQFKTLKPMPERTGITYIIIRDGRNNSNKVQA